MAEFVGQRLRIKTDEGTYEGIVHSIDPVKQRLTLSKGENHTDEAKLSDSSKYVRFLTVNDITQCSNI